MVRGVVVVVGEDSSRWKGEGGGGMRGVEWQVDAKLQASTRNFGPRCWLVHKLAAGAMDLHINRSTVL